MIALTPAGVTVVAVWLLVGLGLLCLLVDAWRHDRELGRAAEKRPVNRRRLARLHVIDRAHEAARVDALTRLGDPEPGAPNLRRLNRLWFPPSVGRRGPYSRPDGTGYYDERFPHTGLDPEKNAAGGHDVYADLGSGLDGRWVKVEPGTYWQKVGTRDAFEWVLKRSDEPYEPMPDEWASDWRSRTEGVR